MPGEFEDNREIDPPKYSFDFGKALAVVIPRYADATPTGLMANVEAYCSGVQRDVSLAFIDGMTVHDIAAMLLIKPRAVIIALEGAIQTIADAAGAFKVATIVEFDEPYAPIDTDFPTQEGDDWRDNAECLNTDPEVFFNEHARALAKDICGRCLVKENCLDLVLETGDEHGIWGGLDQEELDKVRTDRLRAPA